MDLADFYNEQQELINLIGKRKSFEPELKDIINALMVEAAEMQNEDSGFKWWKLNHKKDREKILEEFVDIFFFWLQAGIKAEFTPEEVEQAYLKKHAKNVKRQKENY